MSGEYEFNRKIKKGYRYYKITFVDSTGEKTSCTILAKSKEEAKRLFKVVYPNYDIQD